MIEVGLIDIPTSGKTVYYWNNRAKNRSPESTILGRCISRDVSEFTLPDEFKTAIMSLCSRIKKLLL